VFGIHLATGRTRLFDPVLLRDRTFVSALGFTFLVGAVMMAGAALIPPMLEQLFGYPVIDAGMLMAPRGVGLLIATLIFSRLAAKVDIRWMIGFGMLLTVWSLEMMTRFTLGMGQGPVAISGFVQGIGMGFVVMPLNVLAFAAIPPQQRTDASGLYNLVRGIGGSIGVSVVTAVLAHNVQVSHSEMAANITSQTVPVAPSVIAGLGSYGTTAATMLDNEINRQALMIAYIDDYHLMMLATLASIPLLLLLKRPKPPAPGEEPVHVAVE
jgi:MFS transporter, DHA2 family, multidrug resistance protein